MPKPRQPNTETRLRKSLQGKEVLNHAKSRTDRKTYDCGIDHEPDAIPHEQIDQYARLQGFLDARRDVAPIRCELEVCQTERRPVDQPGGHGQQAANHQHLQDPGQVDQFPAVKVHKHGKQQQHRR